MPGFNSFDSQRACSCIRRRRPGLLARSGATPNSTPASRTPYDPKHAKRLPQNAPRETRASHTTLSCTIAFLSVLRLLLLKREDGWVPDRGTSFGRLDVYNRLWQRVGLNFRMTARGSSIAMQTSCQQLVFSGSSISMSEGSPIRKRASHQQNAQDGAC